MNEYSTHKPLIMLHYTKPTHVEVYRTKTYQSHQ